MIRAAAVLPACALLAGCVSLVSVHVDGAAKPEIHFGLGAPRITVAGDRSTVVMRQLTAGIYVGCMSLGVGVQACEEIHLNLKTCGMAVVFKDTPAPAERNALARLADQVRAECPKGTTP